MLATICEAKTHVNERLNWDEYFMSIAVIASCRSPCSRLNVGSVIVKDKRIISMGYNGFISGAPHNSLVVEGHEQATIHSEINAITDCAKRGVCLDGSVIYITHYPCINCFKCIASCGIKKIIYMEDYRNNEIVERLANDSGIEIVHL
jgi:dCMP deaminase